MTSPFKQQGPTKHELVVGMIFILGPERSILGCTRFLNYWTMLPTHPQIDSGQKTMLDVANFRKKAGWPPVSACGIGHGPFVRLAQLLGLHFAVLRN